MGTIFKAGTSTFKMGSPDAYCQRTAFDAELAQVLQGLLGIDARAAKAPCGLLEDLAQARRTQVSGVAGARAGQGEEPGQRPDSGYPLN